MKRTNSKDRNPQSSCDGKQALTVQAAKQAAKRMGLAPYRCNHCQWWHIGQTNVKTLDKRPRFDKVNDLER